MALRRDVAKRAGVSLPVVSRVLNNSGYVAEEKRVRVLQAVKDLQYKPNPVARSLKSNRTNQILFYIRDLSNSYFLDMYKGMMTVATDAGFNVIISGKLDFEQIANLMVDGVIFPFEDVATVKDLQRIRVPMVAAGYNLTDPHVETHVNVDLANAVVIALDHLTSLGHIHIGFVAWGLDRYELRLETFRKIRHELHDRASPVFGPPSLGNPELQPVDEVNSFEVGITAAKQFLSGDRKATAIVCFNDDTAVGFLSHVQGEGLSVPRDLSVIGIDNNFSSAYTSPPLTSVSINPVLHGRECALAVIDLIEGREARKSDQIPCELVIRKSTGRPV